MIRRRRAMLGDPLPRETERRQSRLFSPMNLFRVTWMGSLVALSFRNKAVHAQELSLTANDDFCGCTSETYTFELDFGSSCPPTNIQTGSGTGVERVTCLISPFGAPTTDLEPVSMNSISILELDQSNSVLVEKTLSGEFFSGFSFSYSSIINDATTIEEIPKALQLNLSGENAEGVMLMNVFVITFTNECGVMPVIKAGESAGWVTFTQMSGPIPRLCPPRAPSSISSNDPTLAPFVVPTSAGPSDVPLKQPSPKPTKLPTKRPMRLPPISIAPSLSMSMSMALTTNSFDLDRSELSEAEVQWLKDILNN